MNDLIVVDKDKLIEWFNKKYRDDNGKPIRLNWFEVRQPPNADTDIYYFIDLDFYEIEGIEYVYYYPHAISRGLSFVKGGLKGDYHETVDFLNDKLSKDYHLQEAIELDYIKENEK